MRSEIVFQPKCYDFFLLTVSLVKSYFCCSGENAGDISNITSRKSGHGYDDGQQSPMPIAEIIVVGGLFFILCVGKNLFTEYLHNSLFMV